jgi:hypothetical protein
MTEVSNSVKLMFACASKRIPRRVPDLNRLGIDHTLDNALYDVRLRSLILHSYGGFMDMRKASGCKP